MNYIEYVQLFKIISLIILFISLFTRIYIDIYYIKRLNEKERKKIKDNKLRLFTVFNAIFFICMCVLFMITDKNDDDMNIIFSVFVIMSVIIEFMDRVTREGPDGKKFCYSFSKCGQDVPILFRIINGGVTVILGIAITIFVGILTSTSR